MIVVGFQLNKIEGTKIIGVGTLNHSTAIIIFLV